MTYDDDTIDWNTVPPAKMFHLVMQELVDVRNELRQEFRDGMAEMKTELSNRINEVGSGLNTLRLEVHQNQVTFIANQTTLKGRVTVLEKEVLKV